ncbi:hypothetical protein PDO_5227 [Rhizobium sp. PDO1-076]|uniref:hypothetical protein n=1 Tax=Rhizobium sp. PDO1-076 TaxID=1125979 RepID=UPI00024E25C8|nr:hypothetical protein [Rhizobium sp. PDO1-076]EHS51177.1 hypothetical protein PDO_5227 [Rhizobium sp. PDO1-076]
MPPSGVPSSKGSQSSSLSSLIAIFESRQVTKGPQAKNGKWIAAVPDSDVDILQSNDYRKKNNYRNKKAEQNPAKRVNYVQSGSRWVKATEVKTNSTQDKAPEIDIDFEIGDFEIDQESGTREDSLPSILRGTSGNDEEEEKANRLNSSSGNSKIGVSLGAELHSADAKAKRRAMRISKSDKDKLFAANESTLIRAFRTFTSAASNLWPPIGSRLAAAFVSVQDGIVDLVSSLKSMIKIWIRNSKPQTSKFRTFALQISEPRISGRNISEFETVEPEISGPATLRTLLGEDGATLDHALFKEFSEFVKKYGTETCDSLEYCTAGSRADIEPDQLTPLGRFLNFYSGGL